LHTAWRFKVCTHIRYCRETDRGATTGRTCQGARIGAITGPCNLWCRSTGLWRMEEGLQAAVASPSVSAAPIQPAARRQRPSGTESAHGIELQAIRLRGRFRSVTIRRRLPQPGGPCSNSTRTSILLKIAGGPNWWYTATSAASRP